MDIDWGINYFGPIQFFSLVITSVALIVRLLLLPLGLRRLILHTLLRRCDSARGQVQERRVLVVVQMCEERVEPALLLACLVFAH